MSTILERRSRLFKDRSAIKNYAGKAVLGPALQGGNATMPELSGSPPGTWEAGLTAPQSQAVTLLWGAISTLSTLVAAYNLHRQPSTLTSTTGDFTDVIADLGTYLAACREDLVRRDIQLTKGVRLKNPQGLEVCGGSLLTLTEQENPLTETPTYEAEDFTVLFGATNTITETLTALSTITAELHQALADNQLLQLN